MFGIDITVLALAGLVALAAAALAYGLLYSRIENEKKAEGRLRRVGAAETDRTKIKAARDRVNEMSKRRKSVQDSLKELEKKQQEKSANTATSMKKRLAQANLSMSLTQFYVVSALFGLFAFVVVLLTGAGPLIAAGVALVGAAGLPRWVVGSMIKRRCKKFLEEFPNALDVMVRSIKSGLPLNDALRLIASDGQEPVRTEFRRVVESQQVGLNVPEACARMIHSVPAAGGEFLRDRHRDPGAGGRQSLRGARQSLQGAARTQEDEGQGQCAFHGGQGVRLHHRRASPSSSRRSST